VQAGTTSYVRLNLGALPANTTIAKATLRLYVNAVAAPGSFDVYQVESGWSEKGLTFNSAPALGASATVGQPVSVTAASQNQFILVDITALAQGWLNGSIPNHGVALALTSSGGSFSFDSKESVGTGHQPELDVVLGSPVGTLGTSSGTSTSSVSSTSSTSTVAAVTSQGKLQVTSDPYVDNGTALQVGANFNIDGNGSAATLNATSQYLLGGSPVLGTNGGGSLFLGTQSGQNNTGNEDTFLGIFAGQNNSTGNFNTFVGRAAGLNNTTGGFNTFIGREAGKLNTTGAYNNFFGTNAGSQNTTGNYNNFIGTFAGQANTTGFYNSFVGAAAGQANTTGSYNNFIGTFAGESNTTGTLNNFVGSGAGQANTTGQYNAMFGGNAGNSTTTGSYNIFFGGAAGVANTTGNYNTFIGMNAGYYNLSGGNNVYIGPFAGWNADPASSENVYIGTRGAAGESNAIRIGDPANQNSAYIAGVAGATTNFGSPVFVDATGKLGTLGGSGGGVTSFNGRNGAVLPGYGDYNFSQITGTLQSTQIGGAYSNSVTLSNSANMFTGTFSGNGSGLNGVNPAPGSLNYIQNTNSQQNANFNITGSGTVGGFFTAQTGLQAFNTTANNAAIQGQDNNTSGQSAGVEGQTQNPTGVGVSGRANSASGYNAGVQGETKSTIGAGVIGVADSATGLTLGVLGYSGSTSGYGVMGSSSAVATGGFTQTCTAFGSCTLTTGIAGQFATLTGGTILQGLSGSSLNTLSPVFSVDSSGNVIAAGVHSNGVTGGVQVYVDSTGHLGVLTSSARFKEQVRDMGDSSSSLMNLRPVTYFYKPQYDGGSRTLQYGLIAEEVANVYPELVAYDPDGKPYTVKYQYLATMLLNEVQKQYRRAEAEAAIIKSQEQKIGDLEQRLSRLEALVGAVVNSAEGSPAPGAAGSPGEPARSGNRQ
jgi:hypothetical protein